jgi:hypothetical protein
LSPPLSLPIGELTQGHESNWLASLVLFHFIGQKGIDLVSLDRNTFIPEATYNKEGLNNRHAGRQH